MANARRDDNFVTALIAVSSVDNITPVRLWADPTTHALVTSSSGGGGSGDGAILDGANSAIKATVLSLNSNPLVVVQCDGVGNILDMSTIIGETNTLLGNILNEFTVTGTTYVTSAGGAGASPGMTIFGVRKDTPANQEDDGELQPLQMAAGRMWVSAKVDTALPAGTNAIGKLAANNGVDIGDVTINNGFINTQPGLYEVLPVTLSDEQSSPLQVSNRGVLYSQIRDAAGNLRGANVNASNQLSVSVDNTVTVGSHAVTNAGTFAVQATLQASSGVDIGKLTANQSVNVAQMNGVTTSMGVGATGTGTQRVVLPNDAGRTLVSKAGTASSSGNNTLVVAGTNRLKVFAFSLSTVSTTAVTCIFQDGASGTALWQVILQTPASVAGGANLVVQPPAWLFATSTATLLNLNLSAAVTVNYSVSYYDES